MVSPAGPSSVLPSVAVVIVCWNNEALLPGCLGAISAQTYPAHLVHTIVVDNGSHDDSVPYLEREHPDVEVMALGWNSGFSIANNTAIRQAFKNPDVRYVALVNSDAHLAPDWMATVVAEALRKPKGASFQSLTLDYADHRMIDSHHIFVARNLQATQSGNRCAHDREFHTERVFGVNAAAALYSRAFLDAQPFEDYLDEQLGMYLEDVDLAARAVVMGWESWFVSGTYAYHMGSASSKKRASGFSLYMTWRNQPGMLISNLPGRTLLRALPSAIKADVQTLAHLRRIGEHDLVPFVVKGRLVGLLRAPLFLRKRKRLAPYRVIDADLLWQLMRDGKQLD